jgi:hypothetical protein
MIRLLFFAAFVFTTQASPTLDFGGSEGNLRGLSQPSDKQDLIDKLKRAVHRGSYWRNVAGTLASQPIKRLPGRGPDLLTTTSRLALKLAEQRGAYWRKVAGTISCEVNGFGPTGGFCLEGGTSPVGGQSCINDEFALVLGRDIITPNNTVIDLGCGFGQYGKFFGKHEEEIGGKVLWKGYDGSENIDVATNGFVTFFDLSEPRFIVQDGDQKFDWSMSIEVAEHLPQSLEPFYIMQLDNSNAKGVVVSWAVVDQDGHGHINNQDFEYVQCLFEKLLGYKYDEAKTNTAVANFKDREVADTDQNSLMNQCWREPDEKPVCQSCYWLEKTVRVFVRDDEARKSAPGVAFWDKAVQNVGRMMVDEEHKIKQFALDYFAELHKIGCTPERHDSGMFS